MAQAAGRQLAGRTRTALRQTVVGRHLAAAVRLKSQDITKRSRSSEGGYQSVTFQLPIPKDSPFGTQEHVATQVIFVVRCSLAF